MNEGQAVWKAQWIWAEGADDPLLQFAYFRTTVMAAEERTAQVRIGADSRYRLWVNGIPVGSGPARGTYDHPYYDTYTVPLQQGMNTLAVKVEYYAIWGGGFFNSVQGGLLCEVEADGEVLTATGTEWKAMASTAYSLLQGVNMLYLEHFDAQLEPDGWEQPGFNDAAWPAAVLPEPLRLPSPAACHPRPIPLLTDKRLSPARLLDAGRCVDADTPDLAGIRDIAMSLWRCTLEPLPDGWITPAPVTHASWPGEPLTIHLPPQQAVYLTLDFGAETLAAPEVDVIGPAGILLDLGYSEVLDDNRVATRWQRHDYGERIVLRDGHTFHRINQPRGFRYLMVRLANPTIVPAIVTMNDLAAYETIYPAVPCGTFQCSDSRLEAIHALSTRTLNLCMEDVYTDCPWRERRLWLGDLQVEALFGYYAFGETALARKCLLEYADSVTPDGWLPGFIPEARPNNYPTWAMRYPVAAWEYYLYTGDASVLPKFTSTVERVMSWLHGYENADGLLENLPGCLFVDWNLLDVAGHADGALQGWYLEALQHSSLLMNAIGNETAAGVYAGRADRLCEVLAQLYWEPSRGAFRKFRPNSPQRPANADPLLIGQHENVQFPLLGIGTPVMRQSALNAIRGATGYALPNLGGYQWEHLDRHAGSYLGADVWLIGSPFWSLFALQALFEAGETDTALMYLRICWGMMLHNGATSCWEMWDRHTTHCHGWSAAPAFILPAYILGVRPLTPGFTRFTVAPQLGDLAWAAGSIPTPHGVITLCAERQADGVMVKISVPDGTEGIVRTADGERILTPGEHEVTGIRSR